MIKNDLEGLCASGHPAEIAAEFEEVARNVREQFCIVLGESIGMRLFEECIENSRLSDEERANAADKEIEELIEEDPEAVKRAEEFLKLLHGKNLRDTDSTCSVEEEE